MDIIILTSGIGGYPENLRGAVYFDTYEEAKTFAEKSNGSLITIRRRDGWRFWNVWGASKLHSYDVFGDHFDNYDVALDCANGDEIQIKDSSDSYSTDVWHYAYAVELNNEGDTND